MSYVIGWSYNLEIEICPLCNKKVKYPFWPWSKSEPWRYEHKVEWVKGFAFITYTKYHESCVRKFTGYKETK